MSILDPSMEQTLRDILQNVPLNEIIKYHPKYVAPQVESRSPVEYPGDYEFFASIVDGEVATVYPAHKVLMPEVVAAWSSNPKIVMLPEDKKNIVQTGWTYNQETGDFSEPV